MKKGISLLAAALLAALPAISSAGQREASSEETGRCLRVMYWNIQNGMWCGQYDNYDSFVNWVKEQNPDICIWCEAQTIYYTGTYTAMKPQERFLPQGWTELARRYGHEYVYVGGHRDNYPQVVTSRYPIESVAKIVGDESQVVSHGAGWARITVEGRALNIVSVHTWPQRYSFAALGLSKEERKQSADAREGDYFRLGEIKYVCQNTVLKNPEAVDGLWLMAGDFNSVSRLDNWVYKYSLSDSRLLVHDYILEHTPYVDIVWKHSNGEFTPSVPWNQRIDFIYCTPALSDLCTRAWIIPAEGYLNQERDANVKSFRTPSDHLPIIAEFSL